MVRDRRIWWGTLALFAGLGAALMIGGGTATADTGASAVHTSTSTSASSAQAAAATGRLRVVPAAAASGTSTTQLAAKAAPKAAATATAANKASTPSAAKILASVLSVFGVSGATPAPAAPATGNSARPASASESAQSVVTPPATNGVTGVKVGHSTLTIPVGSGFNAPADWYFPTQADGSVQANGIIWLQHGFLANKSYYSALATSLAQQTNSIVVVPTLPSFPSLTCSGCTLYGVSMQKAAATMFLGSRSALTISANQAGYQGALPEDFILAGHSAGGGFASSVGGYYVGDLQSGDVNHLLGVVMYDGVTMNGTLPQAIDSLNTLDIPVYQIAAPAQIWNAFGATTNELLQLRPGQFDGVVLTNGSHVDSMLGSNPIIDFFAQLVTQRSPAGNTSAVHTLGAGWINDLYVGAGPNDPQYGIYGTAGQPIIMGNASAVVLPTPLASQLTPIEKLMKSLTALFLPQLFGGSATTTSVGQPASNPAPAVTSPTANGVTGVKTGNTTLTIQVGSRTYNAPTDWYFPTQADGSVQANGIIYLQHGFLANKSFYTVLAKSLAQQTDSIVVATTLPSFPSLTCPTCTLNNPAMQQGVADLFLGDRAALTISASNAGYQGALPEDFTLTGHSAGGGLAVAAGADYVSALAPGAENHLLGVVMFDGVASNNDTFANQLATLDGIPVYTIAAPPQAWNAFGQTTTALIADRPGQFVGAELVNGSHIDSVIGSDPFFDFFAQIFVRPSAPGNATAVHTLAAGWINDFYVGAGPDAPQYGLYGSAGESIIMGQTAAIVLPTQPAAATVGALAA
ncbi:hypothetical protein [Mycolicibacterium sphagni]|nr:hypothetical protein [Mycolicibacterium sphagni]